MSGGKKQQKNRSDSIKNWRFHALPPEHSRTQFTTLDRVHPELVGMATQILAIPVERTDRRLIHSLTREEIDAGIAYACSSSTARRLPPRRAMCCSSTTSTGTMSGWKRRSKRSVCGIDRQYARLGLSTGAHPSCGCFLSRVAK